MPTISAHSKSQRASQWGILVAEWRQSWRPGVAALLGGSVCFALYSSMASLFVMPLQSEFGWSRGEIAFAYSFGILSALLAPFMGKMVDKFGPRPLVLISIVVTSSCYFLFAAMSGSILIYYAIYTLFNIFGLFLTGLTFTRVIIGAFEASRGTALAFSRLGLAFFSAMLPLVLFPVMKAYGPSGGFVVLACLQIFIALPMAFAWIPKKYPASGSQIESSNSPDKIYKLLLSNPKISILALAAVFNYAPVVTIASQLQPLSISKGLQPEQSVIVISILGLSAGFGALISGYLVDRIWAPAIAFALNLLPALGCLLLLQNDLSPFMVYAIICMLGIGQGVEVDIVAFMISKYFNHSHYSTIYGIVVLVIAVGSAIGSSGIGILYDKFGGYNLSIFICALSFLMSSFCYLAMGSYPSGKSK